MTHFTVDSDQVLVANSAVQNSIQILNQEATALLGQLNALQSSWTGLAANSFQELASRWRVTASQVENQLSDIGQALAMAASQYSEIELANQRLFL
jgi:WXG100 family type VII secretion target